ncbi:MAG: sensor histidine kinase [Bacteroidales bacterium]
MRLSTAYRHYVLISLPLILCVGALIQYVIFRETIYHTADETLEEYQMSLERFVHEKDTFMTAAQLGVKENRLNYYPDRRFYMEPILRDTIMRNPRNGKLRNYRTIDFPVIIKGEPYRAEILLRTMGTHDHLLATGLSFICVFVVLMVLVFVLWHLFSRKVFLSFALFMNELRSADINRLTPVDFSETDIDEIRELHDTYRKMMERIRRDYLKTKELSDNITHELQTPLTIMRSKIDVLIQQKGEDEETMAVLQSVQQNINRLSRFNRSMMLLSRIENHSDDHREPVDLSSLSAEKIEEYGEILEVRNIRTELVLTDRFVPLMNEPLAEILLNNLISNAIKYCSQPSGYIRIVSQSNELSIENRFTDILPQGDLFQRFVKNKRSVDANGLGLSIVKAICDRSGIGVRWETGMNFFRIILFRKSEC